MDSTAEFEQLIRKLKAGDQQAATEIFNQYSCRLISLARRKLGPVALKSDPESVVQSVFCSFFLRQQEGRLEVINWQSLWGLLSTITLRKCGHKVDHWLAARRNISREQSPAAQADESWAAWEAIAREPDAAEAAILNETLEQLQQSLSPRDLQIFQLRLENLDVPEIARRLETSERTIRRALEGIEEKIEKLDH